MQRRGRGCAPGGTLEKSVQLENPSVLGSGPAITGSKGALGHWPEIALFGPRKSGASAFLTHGGQCRFDGPLSSSAAAGRQPRTAATPHSWISSLRSLPRPSGRMSIQPVTRSEDAASGTFSKFQSNLGDFQSALAGAATSRSSHAPSPRSPRRRETEPAPGWSVQSQDVDERELGLNSNNLTGGLGLRGDNCPSTKVGARQEAALFPMRRWLTKSEQA